MHEKASSGARSSVSNSGVPRSTAPVAQCLLHYFHHLRTEREVAIMVSQPWAIALELGAELDDCLRVNMDSETLESLCAEFHGRFVRTISD